MPNNWNIDDLEYWDKLIQEKYLEFGLDCYPQEFEICDAEQMLGYMAYSGIPSHYSHWSYGKAFEQLKTKYSYGVSGLPYEMVINTNPALAYLMSDNSLCLQILTMAHVYGHNDFFKNNRTFNSTRAENVLSSFRAHSIIIKDYLESPSVGIEKVEKVLDAAHAISLQCRRNQHIKKLTRVEQKQALLDTYFIESRNNPNTPPPNLDKVPLAPEQDILLFLIEYSPFLSEWEKSLLVIAHEEASYFIPQIETKIMNEGWASYWHRKILNSLNLPQDLHLEFLVNHNQVCRPAPGSLNPYHVGLRLWEEVYRTYEDPTAKEIAEYGRPTGKGKEGLFLTREVDRDTSFIRRFLTKELASELNLIRFDTIDNEYVVSHVSDEDGWAQVKETLISQIGTGSIPVVQVEDMRMDGTLVLRHVHDNREMDLDNTERTLRYIQSLWRRPVELETLFDEKEIIVKIDADGSADIIA